MDCFVAPLLATTQSVVILRESGVSSTPQLFDSITDTSEYRITRWSLSSGAHSRDPVALPTLRRRCNSRFNFQTATTIRLKAVIARSEATKQSILSLCGEMDCFAEPVIGRAFARPVGSQ
jgi:hypothetical protein